MKRSITIAILSLLFLVQCTTSAQLNGTYTSSNNIEFRFNDSTKKFEYFLRSEMGILQYSRGNWQLNNNKLYLQGFNDENLKKIDIESTVGYKPLDNTTQLNIHCNIDNSTSFIKNVVLINNNNAYSITKDTSITLDYKVSNLQVSSYLSYSGLLSSPPKIDTLYSSKINIGGANYENQNIVLKFTVHSYDFVRVKLIDTLAVKNNILYLNNTKLKKLIR